MPLHDRAAQFAPFAALTGHGAALAEMARLTDTRVALSDEDQTALDRTMTQLFDRLKERPTIKVTYFVSDPLKDGGAYEAIEGAVRAVDKVEKRILFVDGRSVSIANITELEGI